MTQNLGAPQVADNQASKEQTINDAVGRLDAALTDVLACPITVSNDLVVSDTNFKSHGQFDCTASGVTAGFSLEFSAGIRKGLFVVTNETGQTATVKVTGQGGAPTLATGGIGLFFCDGVLIRKLV